jgi:hypothetical protein
MADIAEAWRKVLRVVGDIMNKLLSRERQFYPVLKKR